MFTPRRLLVAFLFLSVIASSCSNRNQPFYDEIQAFKKADRDSFPPKNAILFVGSSSLQKWKDIQSYFPGYVVINRGFGGSTLKDVIHYAQEIIIPYHPKQVVIYCGENDIAQDTVSATEVLQRFMELFKIIRSNLPDASIVFISIKPSPSRQKLMPVMEDANIMIRQFLSSYPETDYVDVYHRMLDNDDTPKMDIFLEDSLHMNAKGYAIWKDAIKPHLKRY